MQLVYLFVLLFEESSEFADFTGVVGIRDLFFDGVFVFDDHAFLFGGLGGVLIGGVIIESFGFLHVLGGVNNFFDFDCRELLFGLFFEKHCELKCRLYRFLLIALQYQVQTIVAKSEHDAVLDSLSDDQHWVVFSNDCVHKRRDVPLEVFDVLLNHAHLQFNKIIIANCSIHSNHF